MKKTISIILILSLFILVSGCGNTKVIDNFEYDTYGLFNGNDKRNSDIEYRLIIGNYETPLGQKIISTNPKIIQENMETGQAWGAKAQSQISRKGIKNFGKGELKCQNKKL